MNLFELQAVLRLNADEYTRGIDDAEKKGTGFLDKLANKWVSVKSKFQTVTHFLQPVISTVTDAVDAFAEYQQQAGGLAAIFGDTSEKIIANSKRAWKTAGMDMNTYMGVVLTTGAKMLNDLGGNAEAAADIAELAISDMADNVNAFGSSMDSVMNAYSGISRGQYNMLDNLRLGYGGTKGEMERLLVDAETIKYQEYLDSAGESFQDMYSRLNGGAQYLFGEGTLQDLLKQLNELDSKESLDEDEMEVYKRLDRVRHELRQATGINYSMDSYADMIKAIHTIQENLGITGTTQREADSTVSGSLSQVKALWENLKVLMATPLEVREGETMEEAQDRRQKEISEASQNLSASLKNFLDNIKPIIRTVLHTMVDVAKELIPELVSILPDLLETIAEELPKILNSLADIIVDIINNPKIQSAFWEILSTFAEMLWKMFTEGPDAVKALMGGYLVKKGVDAYKWGSALFGTAGTAGTVGSGTAATGSAVFSAMHPYLYSAGTALVGTGIGIALLAGMVDILNGDDYRINSDVEKTKYSEEQGAIIAKYVADTVAAGQDENATKEDLRANLLAMAMSAGSKEDFYHLFDSVDKERGEINLLADMVNDGRGDSAEVAALVADVLREAFGDTTDWVYSDDAELQKLFQAMELKHVSAVDENGELHYSDERTAKMALALLSYFSQFGDWSETGWTAHTDANKGAGVTQQGQNPWQYHKDDYGEYWTAKVEKDLGGGEKEVTEYTYTPADAAEGYSGFSRKVNGSSAGEEIEETDVPASLLNFDFVVPEDAAQDISEQIGSVPVSVLPVFDGKDNGTTPMSHAKGLWDVPYDDYLANLHRGEMVLTASQARDYREGSGGGSMDVVAAIQSLRNDLQNLQLVVGQKVFGNAVVDYSGKRMQGYIGQAEDKAIAGYGWR